MKNKKLVLIVCVLGAFMLLAGMARTALAAETEEQKQLREDVNKQLADMVKRKNSSKIRMDIAGSLKKLLSKVL